MFFKNQTNYSKTIVSRKLLGFLSDMKQCTNKILNSSTRMQILRNFFRNQKENENRSSKKRHLSTARKLYEHGYFGSIGSGVKFQFFGAHFTSTSRISMRVGAFDSSTLPLCGKNMELACGTSNFFSGTRKLRYS